MEDNSATASAMFARLGEALLTYLLNLDPEQVQPFRAGSVASLSADQVSAFTVLLRLAGGLDSPEEDEELAALNLRIRLSSRQEMVNISVGNLVRKLAGGSLADISPELTEIELLLANLAIDVYPALLMKEPTDTFGIGPSISFHYHPLRQQFMEVARSDPQLSPLFRDENPQTGPGGSTARSSGLGGSHQLWLFAETLVRAGWRLACSRQLNPTAEELLAATLESLSVVRNAVSGVAVTIPARIGIVGALLPPDVEQLEFEWGRLRKADARDDLFVRATSLKGQLAGTTAGGDEVVINYSGDLVLEVDIPYIVKIQRVDPAVPWPEELMIGLRLIDEYLENVRLGALLALPELRPIVAASWSVVLDPMTYGVSASWSDVSGTPGLTPLQLTKEQVEEWSSWTDRIARHRIPTIGVAIRRMLAAASERQKADDVLVDAVIVWENLFGAKSEATLRVTSSLAWLLGISPEDRRTRLSQYKKIYSKRSDVVHGAPTVRAEQVLEYSQQAVGISIESLRALFTTHIHLLDIKNSEDRSIQVLHQG